MENRDWQKDMKDCVQALKDCKLSGYEETDYIECAMYWLNEVKQLKEDNARLTCQFTGAEQKYLKQSNTIAELRGRAENAEKNAQELKEMFDRSYQRNVIANVKIGEHIANAVAEKERADKAEEREQKLKEAYERTYKSIYANHATMNNMENTEYEEGQINGLIQASNILVNAFSTLYPLDREDTTNEL